MILPQQMDDESRAKLKELEQQLLGMPVHIPVYFTRETAELKAAVSDQNLQWVHMTVTCSSLCQLKQASLELHEAAQIVRGSMAHWPLMLREQQQQYYRG